LHGAHPARIWELCRENTSRRALRRTERSSIYDSHYSRGRLPLETKSMIFILRLHPRGLFWVVPIPEGALTVSPDGKTATLEMSNLPPEIQTSHSPVVRAIAVNVSPRLLQAFGFRLM
jgi:hypothetical protein